MSNWQNEFMPEYYRQRVLEEVEQIRLERLALKSHRRDRPSLFNRTLSRFANWMISTGKRLCKCYTGSTPQSGSVNEAPTVNCDKSPTGSLAN
jgi:hypothetical protein